MRSKWPASSRGPGRFEARCLSRGLGEEKKVNFEFVGLGFVPLSAQLLTHLREWKSIESRRKSSAPTPQNRPGSTTSLPGPPSHVIQVFIDYEGEEDDLYSSDEDEDDGSEDVSSEGEALDVDAS